MDWIIKAPLKGVIVYLYMEFNEILQIGIHSPGYFSGFKFDLLKSYEISGIDPAFVDL